MNDLLKISNAEFVEVLASKAPVPGGGGVAAMTGAYGAALAQMVLNLTIGKKKYAEFESENAELLKRAEELNERFTRLVNEDAEAFEPLSRAYSLPKDNPSYEETMAKCTLDAISAPLEMMHLSCRLIELLERILVTGSTLMVSDTGCAALCAGNALAGAAMNVLVNTKILKDRDKAEEINTEVNSMMSEYKGRADTISLAVTYKLSERKQ